ncbi:nucleoside 2-deoxyribosyltransferase [Lactiplantibacillus plantarum]|nr:nucleoside 2-deoxyribosyltransferase [Lactiplantibacillus plantarum]MCB7219677.1 nucleoside 2-deoxyribosyltransferase [Lactiplantibacillus plantarum]UNB87564.1 nucleoside 2-deoxyribosyltransferase [Lactiplantibacillus plantarum]WAI58506.1 nucleoside 2-deoxyribosyltransferase [Lactiplantibacillus plantarum]
MRKRIEQMSTRLMSDEPTIYLAGPWFTEGQPERLAKIEKLMDELELTYYSPRLDGIDLTPDATEADRNAVFTDNVDHLKRAKLVVAVVDGFDTGTIWETGTAYGLDIPVAYYSETLADGTFNVMLAKSGKAVIENMTDLKAFLQDPTADDFQYTGTIR